MESLFPWYGGKAKMVRSLLSFLPYNKIEKYIEVFGGGARLLINKTMVKETVEVYNDINSRLVSIFKCMKDKELAGKLQKILLETDYDKGTFDNAMLNYKEESLTDLEKAYYKWIIITMSFNSACKGFRGKDPEGKIEKTYKKRIESMMDSQYRYKDIIIENLDFEYLIDKYDGKGSFFYLDPPYIFDTRGETARKVYSYELENEMHVKLVDKILKIKGMVLLSGYDHPIYDKLTENGWEKIWLGDYSKSSQNAGGGLAKDKGREYIWKNY